MKISMNVTGRVSVALLLILAGLCATAAQAWPLYTGQYPYTTREVKALLAAALIGLGLGLAILLRRPLFYALAVLGVAVTATI